MSLIIILFIVMLVIFSILWGNRTFSVKILKSNDLSHGGSM